jgi:hypothetical protein
MQLDTQIHVLFSSLTILKSTNRTNGHKVVVTQAKLSHAHVIEETEKREERGEMEERGMKRGRRARHPRAGACAPSAKGLIILGMFLAYTPKSSPCVPVGTSS